MVVAEAQAAKAVSMAKVLSDKMENPATMAERAIAALMEVVAYLAWNLRLGLETTLLPMEERQEFLA